MKTITTAVWKELLNEVVTEGRGLETVWYAMPDNDKFSQGKGAIRKRAQRWMEKYCGRFEGFEIDHPEYLYIDNDTRIIRYLDIAENRRQGGYITAAGISIAELRRRGRNGGQKGRRK